MSLIAFNVTSCNWVNVSICLCAIYPQPIKPTRIIVYAPQTFSTWMLRILGLRLINKEIMGSRISFQIMTLQLENRQSHIPNLYRSVVNVGNMVNIYLFGCCFVLDIKLSHYGLQLVH